MTNQTRTAVSTMVCAGCGVEAPNPEQAPYPFRCTRAGQNDDVDHLMTRRLDFTAIRFPRGNEPNPFIRYRQLFHSYSVARGHGMSDDEYVTLVREIDQAVTRIDGHGFRITPYARYGRLSDRLGFTADGGLWIKDETGNVSGSHKARHLMAIMIYLQVLDRLGLSPAAPRPLAIASCGNAALAAAVIARAAGRPLEVFIPPDAPPLVVERLRQLGACITVCDRSEDRIGDPCLLRFTEALERGAVPFCCQGPANGLTIEGGETLGYEMIGRPLDRIVVQVGGGALASAVIQSFAEAVALGALSVMPRAHTVQTRGAFPLSRAYDRVVDRAGKTGALAPALQYAATHRSEFMWPWETTPRSIAHGILDDETYDWLAIVKGLIESGGAPTVVDEATLVEGYTVARETTGINVDHTGAAGLAGLLQLVRDGVVAPHERVAIIFSGRQR